MSRGLKLRLSEAANLGICGKHPPLQSYPWHIKGNHLQRDPTAPVPPEMICTAWPARETQNLCRDSVTPGSTLLIFRLSGSYTVFFTG